MDPPDMPGRFRETDCNEEECGGMLGGGEGYSEPTRGGRDPVLKGQEGEAAVKAEYDIGQKATVQIWGRTRILDGLTEKFAFEVKNVKKQGFTRQISDEAGWADANGRTLVLFVRKDTKLSKRLLKVINKGYITLKFIPGT